MPLVYLDTSAFLRCFKSEPGSAGIKAFCQKAEANLARSTVLVTSGWTLNESAGVLRREHHKGRITKKEMEETFAEIVAESARLIGDGVLRLEGPTFALCRAAADMTIDKGYRPPDTLQLYTAVATGCTVFLAADSKLLSAAKAEGLEIVDAADDANIQAWLARLP